MAISGAATVNPLVVNLWPDKVPGDPGIDRKIDERRRKEDLHWETPPDCDVPGEEYSRVLKSPIVGSTRLVTNVSKPTLTVYQPAKGSNTGTAMLICPGGGYHDLFWELEGEEVAAWLTSVGMTGIILKYRVPRRPGDPGFGEPSPPPPTGPLLDAQRAISLVRHRAKEWNIHPQRIGMVGFSAGGHLALMTAVRFEERAYPRIDAVDDVSCRPDFAISCYGGYLKAKDKDEVTSNIRIPAGTPPILLAHTSDDEVSNPEHSVFMYLALKRAGIPTELHVYATGNHDFGVRQNGKLPSSWTQLCINWLRDRALLTSSRNDGA
jgi:acetyl esterase/lipase